MGLGLRLGLRVEQVSGSKVFKGPEFRVKQSILEVRSRVLAAITYESRLLGCTGRVPKP